MYDGLSKGEEVYFSIMRTVEEDYIPKNYFCRWDVEVTIKNDY